MALDVRQRSLVGLGLTRVGVIRAARRGFGQPSALLSSMCCHRASLAKKRRHVVGARVALLMRPRSVAVPQVGAYHWLYGQFGFAWLNLTFAPYIRHRLWLNLQDSGSVGQQWLRCGKGGPSQQAQTEGGSKEAW